MKQNVNHSPQLQLFMMHTMYMYFPVRCGEPLETVHYPKGPDFNSHFVIKCLSHVHDQTVCIKNYIAP